MKIRFILIFILLYSARLFACSCYTPKLEQKFSKSDFVAKVQIIKIYKNSGDEEYYKADVKINNIFKGKAIESIYVYGNNGRRFDSSCDIFIEPGEEMIVYSEKNNKGKYTVNMCSGLLYLSRPNSIVTKEHYKNEINVLEILKDKKVSFTNNIEFRLEDSHKLFKKFYGVELENRFTIYKVKFNSDLSVKCVKRLKGFNHKADKAIKKFIKKGVWSSTVDNTRNVVPINSHHLVIIYYNENKEDNNKGFLSFGFYN